MGAASTHPSPQCRSGASPSPSTSSSGSRACGSWSGRDARDRTGPSAAEATAVKPGYTCPAAPPQTKTVPPPGPSTSTHAGLRRGMSSSPCLGAEALAPRRSCRSGTPRVQPAGRQVSHEQPGPPGAAVQPHTLHGGEQSITLHALVALFCVGHPSSRQWSCRCSPPRIATLQSGSASMPKSVLATHGWATSCHSSSCTL
mmetsp:Transcript_114181/g.323351  ORF Transcript_114181/g.323351 Transcript_114181/m.323351 type:complete len:200 (+) Transcript_114181:529-1128(+)